MRPKTIGYICTINGKPAVVDRRNGMLCFATKWTGASMHGTWQQAARAIQRSNRARPEFAREFTHTIIRMTGARP